MDTPRRTPKDIVRSRARNRCEKCGVKTLRFNHADPSGYNQRSIHHRVKQEWGGLDWVTNMVNLCIPCHREIHDDEDKAALGGWIVRRGDPARVPIESIRGWVVLHQDGRMTVLDFSTGRAQPTPVRRLSFSRPQAQPRTRQRYANRPRHIAKRVQQRA